VNVAVNRTTLPGVAEATSELFVMASDATVTVDEHLESVPPAGQLLPTEGEVRVLARIMLPASGLLTVTA
jgi:hypothetical protein